MKRIIIYILCVSAALLPSMAKERETPDTLTASDVLVRMPVETLDLLSTTMRLDLLDYYRADSIYRVPNTMGELSHLHRPLTSDYLKVQITPVTTLTIKVLPYRKAQIAMTSYTIGDSLQAADSDIRFFDSDMHELKRDKFIKPASIEDFLNLEGVDRKKREELLELIPFPTIEYTLDPDSGTLYARLTSGEFLGKETLDKITPYLMREREYAWTGSKFKMKK